MRTDSTRIRCAELIDDEVALVVPVRLVPVELVLLVLPVPLVVPLPYPELPEPDPGNTRPVTSTR